MLLNFVVGHKRNLLPSPLKSNHILTVIPVGLG